MTQETYNHEGPECPHCGHVETTDEAHYFDDMMENMECGVCGKTYACQYIRSDAWAGQSQDSLS